MKEYETIILIRPDSAESKSASLLEKVDGIIAKHAGTILQKNDWGKKDTAYRIDKYNQAFYHYYNYASDSGAVAEIERSLKLSDLALRFLTVKLTDKVDVEARKKEISTAKETKVVVTKREEKPESEVKEDLDKEVSDA